MMSVPGGIKRPVNFYEIVPGIAPKSYWGGDLTITEISSTRIFR
jgi:hypothetical protein